MTKCAIRLRYRTNMWFHNSSVTVYSLLHLHPCKSTSEYEHYRHIAPAIKDALQRTSMLRYSLSTCSFLACFWQRVSSTRLMFDHTLPSCITQQVRGTYSSVLFAYRQSHKQHRLKPLPHQQQRRSTVPLCRSNIRLWWKNRSTCIIQQYISLFTNNGSNNTRKCGFDIVAGVDGA